MRSEYNTKAFVLFEKQVSKAVEWIVFSFSMAESGDKMQKTAASALIKGEENPEKKDKYQKILEVTVGPAVTKFKSFSQFNRRVLFTFAVDAFQSYLADLLKTVHQDRPELLISNQKIEISDLVQFSRMKDLTDYIIERRVTDLSYRSVVDLRSELCSRLNFDLFPKKYRLNRISDLVSLRNLYVHNNGLANRLYLKKVTSTSAKLNEYVDVGDPIREITYLQKVAKDIDQRANSKFRLKQRSLEKVKEPSNV